MEQGETRRGHGEMKQRGRSAPGGASLAAFPVWGFDPFFPPCFSSPSLLRSFPMTGSSCSAHPVSFPNVVQRQPLLCPWPFKTIYSVKIAGPKHEVSGWMSSSVQEQSHQKQFPREHSLRGDHGHSAPGGASLPRFPFWDLESD